MDIPSLLALEDSALEARLYAGNSSYKDNIRYDHFIDKIPYFFEELKKTGGMTIKKTREQKGMLQKQVAAELNIGTTNYNKLENNNREPSVKELQKLSVLFDMTVDQILNFEGELPNEISLEDKTEREQFKLIQQLEEEDKQTVFKIINTMLTKSKFKDFFNKNIAAL